MKHIIFALLTLAALPSFGQQTDSLRMDSIIHELPDVVVKGERPIAKVKGSTIIYDLPRLIEKKAVDNVYDAVKELPGVIEKEGRLSLGGLPTTVILDGKTTTMTSDELLSLLRSLPASRIAKAEVMYNAPAKMQVKGAVVNILLKHRTDGNAPLQGEINWAWNQNHEAKFGERATLLYNKGKFAMDAMYLHSHGKEYKTTDELSHHSLNDGSIHDINSHEISRVSGYAHTYRMGMDYNWAENHRMSLVYNGNFDDHTVIQDISGNITGNAGISNKKQLHNIRLEYQVPFGLKTGAEITYYRNPETQRLISVLPTGPLKYTMDNKQKINRWKFFLAQEHDLKNGWGINYGIVYTSSTNNSGQTFNETTATTGEIPTASTIRQREDDVNIYMGFNKNFGSKLMMEASVAAEYYHTPIWHRWNVYPTFNLTYLPAPGHIFQLGLSSTRTYPEYWAMTNFTTFSNGGYNEITGNPSLRPSSHYQLQLVYVLHNKYQFVSWFNHHDNYFVQTPYQRHDRLTVSYKCLNFDFMQQAGFQAAIPLKPTEWLDSRLTLTGVWQHEKNSHFYDIPFNLSITFGMAKLSNSLTIAKRPDIVLTVDGNIRSKAIQAIFDLPASGSLDLSARWQFWNKRAVLHLYCNDLFESSGINPLIDFKGQKMRMDFSCYREFGVSFTYRFGGYKEKQRKEVDMSRFKK